jgi:hypothetical protein
MFFITAVGLAKISGFLSATRFLRKSGNGD